MNLLNKLAFWKKEDEFDFDKEFSSENAPAATSAKDLFAEPSETRESAFAPAQQNLAPAAFLSRPAAEVKTGDVELMNSKLDTLKAQLSAIEQRLANIERLLGSEQKQRLW